MTSVISVRGRRRADLEADPSFVYVGRAIPSVGWKASPWGNPFRFNPPNVMRIDFRVVDVAWLDNHALISPSMPTIEKCVDLYRQWIIYRRPFMTAKVEELRGKTLGCWCGAWSPGGPDLCCHAVVLAELAEGGGR